jgi:UDP-N-acetylmuramoyl-tripeptide--D-alanyl-D-alanine ligase
MEISIKELHALFQNSTGVSTDSRNIKPGQIFVALKGENFDGNLFVDQAFKNGASYAIISDITQSNKVNVIFVNDTLKTLQDLSNLHRYKFKIPVLALTGTNGKTTTKELINHLLSVKYNTLCTKGNLNNHIGVPLTLLELNNKHEIAIIEMGASAQGEIAELCKIANPNFGLITSIGKAHLEGFGNVATIINTKTELYRYLKEHHGLFFFNEIVTDLVDELKKNNMVSTEIYSHQNMNGNKILRIEDISDNIFLKLKIKGIENDECIAETKIYGNYNFINIVNAIKIADYFGVETKYIVSALENFEPKNNRSQILNWKENTLILDAYNANPTSVAAALKSFEKIEDNNKIIVLGDMLELGEASKQEHINIVSELINNRNKFEEIILVGSRFYDAFQKMIHLPTNIIAFNTASDANKYLSVKNYKRKFFMAKGSRGIRIESIFLQT